MKNINPIKLASITISLVAVSLLLTFSQIRVDLSTGKLFSLSEGSIRVAGSLNQDISIQLFYSKSHPSLSVSYRAFTKRVIELLNEFVRASDGRIGFKIIDIKPDSDEEVAPARKE